MDAPIISEIAYTGQNIDRDGVWKGVPIETYHSDCCVGPSVSKSALKHLIPAHGGSPKAFWGRWVCNPNHIKDKPSDALNFGKAAHCLLLGDEAFNAQFIVRPAEYPDYRKKEARDWHDEQIEAGLTIVTEDQIELIRRMAADAAKHPAVAQGALNGRVERTLVARDPETGIWLKARPDAIPNASGLFADLKTAASFDEDFLQRQVSDAGYYLQGAMTRMICRQIGIPFEAFYLVYILKDDIPDTAVVPLSEFDLDRGEQIIRWSLKRIRHCLDVNEWPGAQPFKNGEQDIRMKPWMQTKIDDFLDEQARLEQAT